MLLDWFAREGWIVINWWLLISVAGLTVLPLLWRLLDGLPDRGYTLARPAGLLLVGFTFWLLAVLGFVNNSAGSIVLAWLIVLGVSLTVYFRYGIAFNLREWWRENRTLVIVAEVLFVLLLVGWAIFRAYQNDMTTTEKPMDLAFMSAIQRSETFPPNDPWLSGYAISYYYFGYVLAAMMSTLAGVPSTTGYNMHIALLFALTGVTVFGVVYNLIRSRSIRRDADAPDTGSTGGQPRSVAVSFALLAVVFVLFFSNLHMVLVELPYRTQAVSEDYLQFWDAKDRFAYNGIQPVDLFNQNVDWWWFAATRAVRDLKLDGEHIEVIAEFPHFSFLLGDSHPHVMALPFALLAMGLALNIVLSKRAPDRGQILLYGLAVGALVFLNTWDSPIYIMMLVGAEVLRRLRQNRGRLGTADWLQMALFGVALLGITFVAYFPFLAGFRSQLGGVLPNIINPTRTQQLFLVFGAFIILLGFFLGTEVWRGMKAGRLNRPLMMQAAIAAGGLLVFWVLLQMVVVLTMPDTPINTLGYYDDSLGQFVVPEVSEVFNVAFSRRVEAIVTPLLLVVALLLVIGRLFPPANAASGEEGQDRVITYPPAAGFALMLIGVGASLVLIPEFFYLRDNFGTRMNTIFKFYYQAWVAFSVASAYGAYSILADSRMLRPNPAVRWVFSGALVVLLAAGLIYPVLGTYNRMFTEYWRDSQRVDVALTLDGGAGFTGGPFNPGVPPTDDYQAIICLAEQVEGENDIVVAEAERDTYRSEYGRVGALTGIPVVANWLGHQTQWRGTGYGAAVGSRRADLETLYTDTRMDQAQAVIDRYGIDYILYGATERQRYGTGGEQKFLDNLDIVCEYGNTRIYRTDSVMGIVSN